MDVFQKEPAAPLPNSSGGLNQLFWSLVIRKKSCWVFDWDSARDTALRTEGGLIHQRKPWQSRYLLAKYAYEQSKGSIPVGAVLRHRGHLKKEPFCVNPDHYQVRLRLPPIEPNTLADEKVLSHFWSKVDRTDSCWVWTGSMSSGGYGTFNVQGRHVSAHRLSYMIHKGPLSESTTIDHVCTNRACVNPNHLEAVSNAENTIRMHERRGFDQTYNRLYHPLAHLPEQYAHWEQKEMIAPLALSALNAKVAAYDWRLANDMSDRMLAAYTDYVHKWGTVVLRLKHFQSGRKTNHEFRELNSWMKDQRDGYRFGRERPTPTLVEELKLLGVRLRPSQSR